MFPFSRRPKRRVPKKYLKPRPMASPARQQHPFWDLIPLGLLACLLAGLVAYAAPLSGVDRWFYARVLRAAGTSAPPRSVMVRPCT